MSADFKNQKAILQEYINEFYVENFEEVGDDTNKAAALQTINKSRNWIYKGKLGYVVDSDGYVHYFLIIENFPKEIRDQIKYGIGEKKYSDYVNCNDVWGVTENLDVYYCKNGQNSIDGVTLGSLSQENGKDEVFGAGSGFAKKITGSDTKNVTKSDLRGISSFTLDSTAGVQNLNDMYNFPNLKDLTIQDVNLTSLDGIEYLTKLNRLYFIRSTVGNYKSLGIIPEQINYLFFENVTNDEIKKFCSYENGVGTNENKAGADFLNLAYFGIYGEKHFNIDYEYDRRVNPVQNSNCCHSQVNDISCLTNLSKITKERIANLFLNNNSLANIDDLWEFKNVERLRIEGNNLRNLKGLYNSNANSSGQGMVNLKYLHAYSNLLGGGEGEDLDIGDDALSVLSETTYDSSTGKYTFKPRFNNLLTLNIERNNIKFLNYIEGISSLLKLYMNSNPNLNLNGIQSIMSVLEKTGFIYDCDKYVTDYINKNSKKLAVVTVSETMKSNDFIEFFNGRGPYLKKLVLNNLILTNDSGEQLTDKSTPTFDSTVNDALKDLNNVLGLSLNGTKNLGDISFVSNMKDLGQIDLRGTSVTDLWPLANNCSELFGVLVDNPDIIVANEPDENGYAEITAIEKLFNLTYNAKKPSLGEFSTVIEHCNGSILCNKDLVDQLAKSTNIQNFYCSYMELNYPLGSGVTTFDLRKTKIKNFFFRWPCSKDGVKFLLPKTVETVTLSNSPTGKNVYQFDDSNLANLNMLKKVINDNGDWDAFMSFASRLPKVEWIDYYNARIFNTCSLEPYYEDFVKIESLKTLNIRGFVGYIKDTTIGYEQLKYISNFNSLENIDLRYMEELKDVSFLKNLTNLKNITLDYTGVHSLEFIRNLNNLENLSVFASSVGLTDFGEDGQVINNLYLLIDAFNQGLRTVDMRSTSITSEEIEASGIKNLKWKSFTY